MTEMFGEAWLPMSVPDLAPDDDENFLKSAQQVEPFYSILAIIYCIFLAQTEPIFKG